MSDAVRQMLNGMGDNKGISALSLVGISSLDEGPNLLEEALNGTPAPVPHPSLDNLDNTEADPMRVRRLGFNADELKAQWKSKKEEPQEVKEPEDDKADEQVSKASPPEELPSGYHSLNAELQREREERIKLQAKQEEHDRYYQQQRIATEQWQRQQQANQPDPITQLSQELGFDEQSLRRLEYVFEHRQMQKMGPILAQSARDRFEAQLAQVSKLEQFDKYFMPEQLRANHEAYMQRHGIEAAMRVDWKANIEGAHRDVMAPHYLERAIKAEAELEKLKGAGTSANKDKKAEQKSGLAKVPKASHASPTARPTMEKELDALPSNLRFAAFGRELGKRLGIQR